MGRKAPIDMFNLLNSVHLFPPKQDHILRHHNEELRGIKYIAKVAYHHKVCAENDV